MLRAQMDSRLDRSLPSPIAGVSNRAWTKFVRATMSRPLSEVSLSNALGMFEMRMPRLADLGLATNLRYVRGASGRMVWAGDFVAPMTVERFLSTSRDQYLAFAESMKRFALDIAEGRIARPEGMSLAATLAVLHRAGPSGAAAAARGDLYPETRALVSRVKEIF